MEQILYTWMRACVNIMDRFLLGWILFLYCGLRVLLGNQLSQSLYELLRFCGRHLLYLLACEGVVFRSRKSVCNSYSAIYSVTPETDVAEQQPASPSSPAGSALTVDGERPSLGRGGWIDTSWDHAKEVDTRTEFIDLRLAVLGNVDVGKSTILGVLTQGELDNGRGRARLNLFRHLHEIQSGRTSSISHEIIGFNNSGQVFNYSESRTLEEIIENSTKIITLIDLCGHHKYLKTTIFGLTGYSPDFAMLVVSANTGLVGTTKEHLGFALALGVPTFVVVTKVDTCRSTQVERTLRQLERTLKGPGCRKVPLRVETEDDAVTAATNFNTERFQIPKGLSNYERAVIERQLSRFKLRDLRGNANPYWKQDHSSSTVKHIRTAAVSPNSQGDAAVSPTVTDDSSSFPDPYACTRPCGGSHTLTSPYKRVIHMADLNSPIMTDEENTNQQNHENTPPSSCPPVLIDRSPVIIDRGPVINGEETEEERATVPAHLDKGHMNLRPNSGTDSLAETTNAVAAHSSVVKDLSDDSGRRFSDPSTFRLEDYAYWLENHTIHLVNYVSEVGTKVLIPSPITPAPVGIRWFSLNMDGELPHSKEREVSMGTARYLEKFQKTYNISWHNVFKYDELGRWLRILNVRLEYADVFQVYVEENKMARTGQTGDETFGVDITFMTFEKHECDFTSKPPNPKKGDVLILNCSVIVNGLWNASLVFRNDFDGSETRGQVSQCGRQPSVGSRICSTVKVKAATTIFAYSCLLEFPSDGRHRPIDPMFKHSKWTDEFNMKVVCNLPKIYLESIPSDVTFLCNRKPCEDTALVDDTVTCVAPGFPEPIFDLRIQHLSAGRENKSQNGDNELNNRETRFIRDTADFEKAKTPRHVKADIKTVTIDKIKVSENYQISRKDVGQVEITCNTSNALGSGYKALVLEVKSQHGDNITDTERSDAEPAAASGDFQPYGGLTMLCNGRVCKDKGIMRFGDEIACHYDQNKIGGKLTFILKIDGYEKTVAPPCVYTLRTADVGKKFVQCIGYIDSSISVLEAHVFVACAFRYPQGDPHRTEDYDDTVESAAAGSEIGLVILCNDVPCNRPGRTIHSKVTYLTCRYTDQRVSSLTLMVNGAVMFQQTPENTTEGFHKLQKDGDLSVKCFDSLDNNVAVTINIAVQPWPSINGSSAGKKADLKKASGVKPSSVGDRRISAPNTSSSVGSTPQSSTTHQKKRRFSTPVTMSTKDASSPVAHFKKVHKENEMKEEEDNKEAEEEETTKNNNRDNSEQQ